MSRVTIYSLDVLLFLFGTSLLFQSSSNCCCLTCIQVSQEEGQVVWYAHLLQNFLATVRLFSMWLYHLCSNQQCMRVPVLYVFTNICYCPIIPQNMAILVHGKRYLIMVLICISLVTTEVEQFLMCLLAIWISSLKKYHSNALPTWKLVYLFVHFKIVWLLTCKYSSHTVGTTNSLLHDLQIFFPHSVTYLFTFLIVSLDKLKIF